MEKVESPSIEVSISWDSEVDLEAGVEQAAAPRMEEDPATEVSISSDAGLDLEILKTGEEQAEGDVGVEQATEPMMEEDPASAVEKSMGPGTAPGEIFS